MGIWILAYTASLADLALLFYWHRVTKDKKLLFLLLILANMSLVTAICMVLATIGVMGRTFDVILLNSCLPYYITVSLFIYEVRGIRGKRAFIASIFGATAVAFNVLAWNGQALFAYILFWLPFVVLVVPIIPRGPQDRIPDGTDSGSATSTVLKASGQRMALITLVMGALFGFLMLTPLAREPLFTRTYFALFTIVYQLPVLLFCLGKFHEKKPIGQASISLAAARLSLTAREREVALRLYEGLTYEQIAEQLFVSLSAIKKHAYNIYRKTGARNNRQLMHMMTQAGDVLASIKERS
jgi:DNA-binding CsgD family transcriptional regulator